MRYRRLGGTGMEVSAHCLGTMMFGSVGNPDHDECARIVHAALDRGVNFVDTADMYSDGESEEIVGKALRGRRDEVILATKGHFAPGEGGPNRGGNSRRWLLTALEDSLRRLGTEWVDLYQVHRPDDGTDIEETLAVLDDMVAAGKVRAYGCSTFPPERIVDAFHVARRRGLGPFRTEQAPYSILARGVEAAVLPLCRRLDMGVLTWSPLAFGFLTGRYRRGGEISLAEGRPAIRPDRFDPAVPENAAKLDIVERLIPLAESIGCSLPQLAVAFPLVHPAVASVILGPRTMAQLEELLDGAGLELEDSVLDRIDEIAPPGVDHYRVTWAPSLDDVTERRRWPGRRAAAPATPKS